MTEYDQHPLNKQARKLLKLASCPELPWLLPVLQLGYLAVEEGQEDSDEAINLEAWTRRNPKLMLEILEAELPDGLPEDPMEAAADIIWALQPLDPYRDLR